jgi:hypothetical protein
MATKKVVTTKPGYARNARLCRNRAAALRRDEYMCRLCTFDICLEVHHIVRPENGGDHGLSNLVTLCPNHHALADRGMVGAVDFARALEAKTDRFIKGKIDELLLEAAERISNARDNGLRLADVHAELKAELPWKLRVLYRAAGVKVDANAIREFPQLLGMGGSKS